MRSLLNCKRLFHKGLFQPDECHLLTGETRSSLLCSWVSFTEMSSDHSWICFESQWVGEVIINHSYLPVFNDSAGACWTHFFLSCFIFIFIFLQKFNIQHINTFKHLELFKGWLFLCLSKLLRRLCIVVLNTNESDRTWLWAKQTTVQICWAAQLLLGLIFLIQKFTVKYNQWAS